MKPTTSTQEENAVAEQATFHRSGKAHFATAVHPASADRIVLSPHNSAFKMIIPKQDGRQSFVGCIHTNPLPFNEVIPENEFLVAPIIDIHKSASNLMTSHSQFRKYFLRIPHCLDVDAEGMVTTECLPTVRHGNIYTNQPFTSVPYRKDESILGDDCDIYYDIDPLYINIHTSTFSQFTCTLCRKKCTEDMVGIVSARFKMMGERNVEVMTFVCYKLYTILDYKQVDK